MFCKNCGKGLGFNPDKTCPDCGSDVIFCRNCGKGLVLTPDKTCTSCGTNPAKATSFCRYCGKPTGPQDVTCPACGSTIKSNQSRVLDKENRRLVKMGDIVSLTIAIVLVILCIVFVLPAKVTRAVLTGLGASSAPAPKLDLSKNVTVDLVIENGVFYPDKIYAEVGSNLIINFTNKDTGVEHNFVLYREVESNPSASFIQKLVLGPGTAAYKFKVPIVRPDGAYWFACGPHYADEQGLFYSTWPKP